MSPVALSLRRSAASRSSRPSRSAALVVTAIFTLVMLGGALPSPLYVLWAQELGFGAITTTILFAAYAVGIVVALVAFAPMSDRAGRRPLLVAALATSAVSTVLFIAAGGVPLLFVARLLSGIATGVVTATATSALTELTSKHTAFARAAPAAANLGGLGLGPVVAGLFAQLAPHPTTLVFWAYLGALALAAVALVRVPETVAHTRSPKLALRKPRLPDDPQGRRAFVSAAAYMSSGFMVSGLFGSLVPSFLRADLHERNLAVVGLIVGLLFLVGMTTQVTESVRARPLDTRRIPVWLIIGLVLIEVGLLGNLLVVFIAGTIASGIGFGLATLNGVTVSQRLAGDGHRADITATVFIAAYAGITVSTIGVGVLVQTLGTHPATLIMAVAVILAILAAHRLQQENAAVEGD